MTQGAWQPSVKAGLKEQPQRIADQCGHGKLGEVVRSESDRSFDNGCFQSGSDGSLKPFQGYPVHVAPCWYGSDDEKRSDGFIPSCLAGSTPTRRCGDFDNCCRGGGSHVGVSESKVVRMTVVDKSVSSYNEILWLCCLIVEQVKQTEVYYVRSTEAMPVR